MRLTLDQFKADARKMKRYICSKIPKEGTRIVLADGPEGGEAWAELNPVWDEEDGWDLHFETNEPEWVDLGKIYEHFRVREVTSAACLQQGASPRKEPARISVCSVQEAMDFTATKDENGLPREVSTREAARVLGVSKDTVLKLKAAGLLEYRNTAPPDSSRAVYRFRLASVVEFRMTYQADVPFPALPSQPKRRYVRGRQQNQFKHLRLD